MQARPDTARRWHCRLVSARRCCRRASVISAVLVKFSVSPAIRPLLIVTVAPVRLVSPSKSLIPRPESSSHGSCAAAGKGGGCAGRDLRSDRDRNRAGCHGRSRQRIADGPVDGVAGADLIGGAERDRVERGLVLLDGGAAGQRQLAVAVRAADAVLVGEVQGIAGEESVVDLHGRAGQHSRRCRDRSPAARRRALPACCRTQRSRRRRRSRSAGCARR